MRRQRYNTGLEATSQGLGLAVFIQAMAADMVSLQVGDSLEEFLLAATPDAKLRQCLMSLSEATRTIAFKVPSCLSILRCSMLYIDMTLIWQPCKMYA